MGKLFIVATPIGNLQDISLRAIDTLKEVDYILCEDTRVTGKLLNAFLIEKRMVSFNEFNENQKTEEILRELAGDVSIALVSDAGTPLVSDPGYKLVRDAISKGVEVESIPGPSAVVTALTVSGLPPDRFLYIGYLPKKEGKRKEILSQIKAAKETFKSTVIFYESPFRLLKAFEEIKETLGDIDIVVCRELTKKFEEIRREKVSVSIVHFGKTPPKGEFTVLL
ncbi:16S rRNA (cytidine(1402)-2'-O)-methyltransferase [Candidatus Curtissbacteria bacterium]|nr:16S rRNA (cytidine(1402)-2'-O)-methyltransferase [Candidatus Curtissbacteria bacterium]